MVGFPVPTLVPPRGSVPDLYACRCQVLQAASLQTQLVFFFLATCFAVADADPADSYDPADVRVRVQPAKSQRTLFLS